MIFKVKILFDFATNDFTTKNTRFFTKKHKAYVNRKVLCKVLVHIVVPFLCVPSGKETKQQQAGPVSSKL